MLLNELAELGLLHTDLITATGKTVGENIKGCTVKDTEIIRPVKKAYSQTGGILYYVVISHRTAAW